MAGELKTQKKIKRIKTSKPNKTEINLLQKTSSNITYLLVSLLIIASFLLGMLFTKVQYLEQDQKILELAQQQQQIQPQQPQAPKITLNTIKSLFKKDLIKFNDENKKLLFVEIADPSCPYCHIAAGKNPELNKQIGDKFILDGDGGTYTPPVLEMRKLIDSGKASFVYIYQNGHGNGELAMKALYCSNEQGKFWEAHDKLMTNDGYELINSEIKNDKSQISKLIDFLNETVDTTSLESCIESNKFNDRLRLDSQLAKELGATGTPAFFINTTFFSGAANWTSMKDTVNSALK